MPNMRKGLSSIVSATLIMLLSISSLFMVWAYVKDITSDFENQLAPTVGCIQQKSKILNACINTEGKIEVNFDISPGEIITRTELMLNGESFSCGSNSCQSCSLVDKEGRTKLYLNPSSQASTENSLVASINGCAVEQFPVTLCN